jgi:NTP pyrophosphatase (non-canonical NTP hydrolase)
MGNDKISERDELMVILMEECSEVAIEAAKMIRFGYDNNQKLESEVGDLMCMLNLLHEWDLISWNNVDACADAKREKLKKWSNLTLD